jgi:hypothetical protein
VPAPEFIFALDLSDPSGAGRAESDGHAQHPVGAVGNDAMLNDVTTAALKYAGFGSDATAELLTAIRGALATATLGPGTRCHLQFKARAGQLEIAVSGGGADQKITRPLPG